MTVKSLFRKTCGLSVVEVLISVILISMLFYFSYNIMTYARVETEKGFWLHGAITDLRTGVRMISQKLKKTSYPSTVSKSISKEIVTSFKELREYDGGGRLRNLVIRQTPGMDMYTMEGPIDPQPSPIVIMHFPICTPEIDTSATYIEGTITWVQLVLEPADHFSASGLGNLRLIEQTELYDTRSLLGRVYDLDKTFDPTLTSTTDKIIVRDVSEINISLYSVDELRGIYVTTQGQVSSEVRKRFLVSLRIECMHPKDDNLRIGDQCSVVNHIDVHVMGGGGNIEVLSTTPPLKATIRFNGEQKEIILNDKIGGGTYQITGIAEAGITVTTLPSGPMHFYPVKE